MSNPGLEAINVVDTLRNIISVSNAMIIEVEANDEWLVLDSLTRLEKQVDLLKSYLVDSGFVDKKGRTANQLSISPFEIQEDLIKIVEGIDDDVNKVDLLISKLLRSVSNGDIDFESAQHFADVANAEISALSKDLSNLMFRLNKNFLNVVDASVPSKIASKLKAITKESSHDDDVLGKMDDVIDEKMGDEGYVHEMLFGPRVFIIGVENLEESLEVFLEWLDEHAPGHLGTPDYEEIATELGMKWDPANMSDEDVYKVQQVAEEDWIMASHTTLENGEGIISHEWNVREMTPEEMDRAKEIIEEVEDMA